MSLEVVFVILKSIYKFSLVVFLLTYGFFQVTAKQMSKDHPYYDFASSMLGKTQSTMVECEQSLQNDASTEWLCARASIDETQFKNIWDIYVSVRPAGTSLSSISAWGKITITNDSAMNGKLYKTDAGYLVISYDTVPETSSNSVKIGYSAEFEYLELPFYIAKEISTDALKEQLEQLEASLAEDVEDSTSDSESNSDNMQDGAEKSNNDNNSESDGNNKAQ